MDNFFIRKIYAKGFYLSDFKGLWLPPLGTMSNFLKSPQTLTNTGLKPHSPDLRTRSLNNQNLPFSTIIYYHLREIYARIYAQMASFRKVKKGWRAEVCVKGVRDSGTFDTKSDAMKWALEREEELKASKDKRTETCADLFDHYLKKVSPKKRGHKWEVIRLSKFIDHPLFDRLLSDVTTKHICQWRDSRLEVVSPSTVRREMNLLGHCFEVARKDLHWIEDNPCNDADKPKEPPHRDRLISEGEIKLIRHALGWPHDTEAITRMQKVAVGFCFAIETAMRMGEICNLKPSDISGNVATLGMTKNGTKREVPLSKRALELLSFVPELWQMDSKQFEALFRKGRDRSGVGDLVFHDTRHEAITRLAKKLDVLDLARMVGHKDIKQLMTYYNESATNIADRLG